MAPNLEININGKKYGNVHVHSNNENMKKIISRHSSEEMNDDGVLFALNTCGPELTDWYGDLQYSAGWSGTIYGAIDQ
uniref:hypothetical protein n=1 Tax=Caballeronia sp. GAFFF3 TaxID=2921759 RepID=UPI0020287F61